MKKLILIAFLFAQTFVFAQSYDICGNGIDDDGDGLIDEACIEYSCDGKLYQTSGNTLNEMELSPVKFNRFATFPRKVNGTGYNPADNYIYTFMDINGSSQYKNLTRVDSSGNYEIIGPIKDSLGNEMNIIYAADFGVDGTFYVLEQQSLPRTLYAVDVNTLETKPILHTQERITDIAFNPTNEKLYGIADSKNLYELDPIKKTCVNLGKLTGIEYMNYGSVGATYFTLTGTLVTYGVYTGSGQDDLVFVDIENVTASLKQENAIANQSMDGCSCPYTIVLEKTASDSIVSPGETFTYRFNIYNKTRFVVHNADFSDTLDNRLEITKILVNGLGAPETGTGIGTNILNIKAADLPIGEVNLEIEVRLSPDANCSEPDIRNQAYLKNLPALSNKLLPSDDPTTVKELDPTWVKVETAELQEGILSAENMSECNIIDTLISYENYAGILRWEESEDSVQWIDFSGEVINDSTIHIIQPQINGTSYTRYYRAVLTDGCATEYAPISINTKQSATIFIGADIDTCSNEPVVISAPSNYKKYIWSNGETTQKITVSGTNNYTVTVSNDDCGSTGSINVAVWPLPEAHARFADTACAGTSLTVDAGTGGEFVYNSTVYTEIPYAAFVEGENVFEYIYTDPHNCTLRMYDTVYIKEDIQFRISETQTFCKGESRIIGTEAVDEYEYKWSNGDTGSYTEISQAGIYQLTVSSQWCSATESVHAVVRNLPPSPQAEDIILCPDDNIPLIEAFGDNIYWYLDENLDILLDSGKTVTLPDQINSQLQSGDTLTLYAQTKGEYCNSKPKELLIIRKAMETDFSIQTDSTVFCEETYNMPFSAGGYIDSLKWEIEGARINHTDHNTLYLDFLEAGTPKLFAETVDRFGCWYRDSIELAVYPIPDATIKFDIDDNIGYLHNISDNPAEDSVAYFWMFYGSDGWKKAVALDTVMKYEYGWHGADLKAVNKLGCDNYDRKDFYVELPFNLMIPNAFAPDHEAFLVSRFKAVGYGLEEYKMWVYDVWGNLVWYTEALDADGNPSEFWDGTYKGAPLKPDCYTWKVYAKFTNEDLWEGVRQDDGTYKNTGSVILIR